MDWLTAYSSFCLRKWKAVVKYGNISNIHNISILLFAWDTFYTVQTSWTSHSNYFPFGSSGFHLFWISKDWHQRVTEETASGRQRSKATTRLESAEDLQHGVQWSQNEFDWQIWNENVLIQGVPSNPAAILVVLNRDSSVLLHEYGCEWKGYQARFTKWMWMFGRDKSKHLPHLSTSIASLKVAHCCSN